MIMREVRLPRTLLAAMVGMSLGLAGATLQGFLRNPLVDPGVIGVTSSASLGAVLAFYTGFSLAFPLALPLMGIAGALLCVLLLQGLAGRGGVLTLILAGVAVAAVCAALMSLVLNLSPNPYASAEIMFWLMGSVTDRSIDHVLLASPFMAVGWVMLAASARSLDALSLGEESASSLGVNLGRTRALVITGTAVSVGAGTAVTGGIGFIGLVVPHLLRPLVGHTPSRLLLASALGGGSLLLAADILVRIINVGSELKLGVVTAIIGAPFFLWLILKARTELES
jgi:iron complex transport system permease protein